MAEERGGSGEDYVVEHPNREKAASKATKAIVVLLLLVSAALVLIIMLGGWSYMQGGQAILIGYIILFVLIAFMIARWVRGLLPVAAALSIVLLIFAAVAAPAWFDRDKAGFASPTIDAPILGLLTFILIGVQVLLIAFALRGFTQGWHVEVERPVDGRREQPA
jgi:hypothetical protein